MQTPEQRAYAQKRYEKLKSRGLCVACGKVPAQTGKTKCTRCGVAASKSALSWYYRKHKEVQHGTE